MISARRVTVPLAVAFFAILGVACGGGGESTNPPAAPDAQTTTPAQGADASGDTLVMRDNEFVPSDFTIQAGSRINLRNEGQAPHNLSVVGQDVDHDVQAGESENEDLELQPGTYQIFCKFHRAAGMTGTLTVEG